MKPEHTAQKPLHAARWWLACAAVAVAALVILYTFAEPVGALMYDALGDRTVCATVPVAYARLVLGSEPLAAKAAHAASLALFSLWLFASGTSTWPCFYAVAAAQTGSLLFPRIGRRAALWAVGAALFALAHQLDGGEAALPGEAAAALRVAATIACALAAAVAAAAELSPLPRLDGRRAALAVAALAVAAGAAPPLAAHLLPVREFSDAYALAARLTGARQLDARAAQLALVTAHVQLPLGYVGVAHLRAAQARKNALRDVGDGARTSAAFARAVGEFVCLSAVPYFAQRSTLEILNQLEHVAFGDWIEGSLRVDAALADGGALAAAASSNLTVDAHASALRSAARSAVDTVYQVLERRAFALPKLALFPGVVARHPRLALLVLPVAFGIDAVKAKMVAKLTERVEALRRERKRLLSMRTRVEAHDAKNAGLIAAARAIGFTRGRWRALTARADDLGRQIQTFNSLRNWIRWLYWQDIFHPAIECVIAYLLEAGDIRLDDIWVYSRVVEDAMESALLRSRHEAELAQLGRDVEQLTQLADGLEAQRARAAATARRLACRQADAADGAAAAAADAAAAAGESLRVTVRFRRGAASVRVAGLTLPSPAVYALVGRNGCGKSSLFALLGACAAGGVLPADIALDDGAAPAEAAEAAEVALPRGELVQVSQRQYCPLHARPIEWLAHALPAAERPRGADEERALAARAAALAATLRLGGGDELAGALLQEQDDFCGTLSGGQRAKLDLIAQVLLRRACPAVLLLDEAFAPLDPASKGVAMRALKAACASSLILAIYHGDDADGAGEGGEAGGESDGHAAAAAAAAGPAPPPADGSAAAAAAVAAEMCAVGERFFDGVVSFGEDGNVTLSQQCRTWTPRAAPAAGVDTRESDMQAAEERPRGPLGVLSSVLRWR